MDTGRVPVSPWVIDTGKVPVPPWAMDTGKVPVPPWVADTGRVPVPPWVTGWEPVLRMVPTRYQRRRKSLMQYGAIVQEASAVEP